MIKKTKFANKNVLKKFCFCLREQNVWVRTFFFKCALNDYYSASSYLLNLYFIFFFFTIQPLST